jgi:hypothetical protein
LSYALIARLPTRWIGRSGLIAWPPRCSDPTPLERLHVDVCERRLGGECATEICVAVATVSANMLRCTWLEMRYDTTANGAHIDAC